MKRFEQKVCLVTGSSMGIGEYIMKKFLDEGAIGLVNSRSQERVDKQVAHFRELGYENVYGFACDVSDKRSVEAMMAAIRARFGRLDVLVNNAGINYIAPSYDLDADEYLKVLHTNLAGELFCAQEAGKLMRDNGGGAIVNIASVFGQVCVEMRAPYSSSKSGLFGLTKVLAVEWAKDGIRVNSVAPGYIKTGMGGNDQDAGGYDDNDVCRRTPMGRYGTADEVANVVAFLASDEASYVTGSCYNVDGGWTAFGGWC